MRLVCSLKSVGLCHELNVDENGRRPSWVALGKEFTAFALCQPAIVQYVILAFLLELVLGFYKVAMAILALFSFSRTYSLRGRLVVTKASKLK